MFRVLRDLLRYDGRFRFAFILLAAVGVMILLSFVSPDDPNKSFVVAMDVPPSLEHLFGTNSRGQDIFWWLTFAVRNSLIMGVITAVISRVIAILVGLTAGYQGGWLGGGVPPGPIAIRCSNTVDSHEARNTMLTARLPGFSKIKEDARRSIDAMARHKRGADKAQQPCILLRSV